MGFIRKIFEKASFHGFAYIARTDIHWLERTLWGVVLLFATYWSTSICWNQWERYKENPTVFGVERVVGTRCFPYVGVTMCSNYFDHNQAAIVIKDTWNVDANDTKLSYYMEFLKALNTLQYDKLDVLELYENDSSVANVPFLKLIRTIRSTLFSTTSSGDHTHGGGTIEYGVNGPKGDTPKDSSIYFHSVITEVGMCVTTSFLHTYQNPLGLQSESKQKHVEMCSPFDVCNLKLSPSLIDNGSAIAYIHNNRDIVPQDDKAVIRREMAPNEITNVDVDLQIMSAEKEVRNVPILYRKCRFPDENNLKYFRTYRPILCRNECRINAALKLCKCKPFFYIVGTGPVCSVKGMLCLVRFNWTDTKCEQCFELCSVMTYTALKATAHNYSATRFEKSLLINLSLPKMATRRRVVFSTDQLVVAFGGAASLFLGCSFLSFAQILYYCLQSLGARLKRWYSLLK